MQLQGNASGKLLTPKTVNPSTIAASSANSAALQNCQYLDITEKILPQRSNRQPFLALRVQPLTGAKRSVPAMLMGRVILRPKLPPLSLSLRFSHTATLQREYQRQPPIDNCSLKMKLLKTGGKSRDFEGGKTLYKGRNTLYNL